jgi:colicin import membrane protein
MHAAADRPEFEPPPQRGMVRAGALALLAHLLLVIALTYGLKWKNEAENVSAEAELWSTLPQEAAPQEVPTPPPPPPQPAIVRAPPLPEPPVQRDADIALEQEKKKRELAERKQAELEREREKRKKQEAERKREEERERKELLAKQAAEAKKKDEALKRKQEQDAKKLAQLREENMRRMQGMAGTGAPSATGTAARSSGPSASWGGRVQARVRPNIVFTDDIAGNPKAEVEVRLAPDGTIVGKRIVKSSGVKAWDDAVLRALDKTEILPRDVDGRVPTPVVIEFKPKG